MAYRRKAARPSTAARPAPEAATRLPAPVKELGDGETGLTGTTDADGADVAVGAGGAGATEELMGNGGITVGATAVVTGAVAEMTGAAEETTGTEETTGVETTGAADGVKLTAADVASTGLVIVHGQLVIVRVVA